jgi:hypothetical protein
MSEKEHKSELLEDESTVTELGQSHNSTHLDDTQDKNKDPEEKRAEMLVNLGFKEYVDFVPPFKKRVYSSKAERVTERVSALNEEMLIKEKLKMKAINEKIHNSYYKMWVADANKLFRSIVYLKRSLDSKK